MKTPFFALLALALAGAVTGSAEVIYNNTANDTFVTYFFSTGPYDEIGDMVNLGGTSRLLTDASIQFYNGSSNSGTFTALLSFWNVGSPVGSQIGSTYSVGASIGAFDILTVNFTNLNLFVPSSLIFTVGVANVTPGLDLGLNVFTDPSNPGSSNDARIILNQTGVFSEGITNPGEGNLYLQLQAVPEPSTITMSLGAVAFVLIAARRRRRVSRD
jgi:hypothetical protein